MAHVERAGDLVVLDDRAELEYGRRRREGSDAERVEEVGDEAEAEQASKVEAARSVSRRGLQSRYPSSRHSDGEWSGLGMQKPVTLAQSLPQG